MLENAGGRGVGVEGIRGRSRKPFLDGQRKAYHGKSMFLNPAQRGEGGLEVKVNSLSQGPIFFTFVNV